MSQKSHPTRKMKPFGLEQGVLVGSVASFENEKIFGPRQKSHQMRKIKPFGLELTFLGAQVLKMRISADVAKSAIRSGNGGCSWR